ncbi:MAG: IclR family transcriptional regulator [Lautropia sp.]
MSVQTRSPLERGLAILDLLVRAPAAISLDAIAEALEVNKSSAFRLLEVIEAAGLATRPADGNGYLLGSKALGLGEAFRRQFRISGICDESLVQLREDTGESTGVFVLSYPERVCIAAVESRAVVRRTLTVGQLMPLHSGAVGKVLLAHLDATVRQGYLNALKSPFRRGRRMVTRDDIRKEAEQALADGYAISSEETLDDVWGIAVPIVAGELVAGMVVSGPMSRFPSAPGRVVGVLKQQARRIVSQL